MMNQASTSPVAPAGARQRLLRALNRFLSRLCEPGWAARLPGLNIDDAGLTDHVKGELAS